MALSAFSVAGAEVPAGESKSAALKSKSVRLDSDGMLAVNGQRKFILGLYSLPTVA